jgi:hypothetical protein
MAMAHQRKERFVARTNETHRVSLALASLACATLAGACSDGGEAGVDAGTDGARPGSDATVRPDGEPGSCSPDCPDGALSNDGGSRGRDAEPMAREVCGDGTCVASEDCSSCAADCGTCDGVFVVEGEHFITGSDSAVRTASETGGIESDRLSGASGEAAAMVSFQYGGARYLVRSGVGAHELCARVAPAGETSSLAVRVAGVGRLRTDGDIDAWTWLCLDFHVSEPRTEITLEYFSRTTLIDKVVLAPAGVLSLDGSELGPEAAPTCDNGVCQENESCGECWDCCDVACGDGQCHAEESCGTCAEDCGDCGAVYTGFCHTTADIERLPAGHFCAVPDSHAARVEKKPEDWADYDGSESASFQSYQRVQGFSSLMRTWNGGAFDTARQRLILFGGGHNDYGGNELIAFDLDDLSWSRIADPTAFPNRHPASENDDGTPISRHTYAGLEYLPSTDRYFVLGGAPDYGPGACGTAGTWTFDLASNEAAGYEPSQWHRSTASGEPSTGCEDNAVYDPLGDRVLYITGRSLYAYDVAGDAWSSLGGVPRARQSSLAAAEDGTLVQLGGGLDGYLRYDLSADAPTPSMRSTTGDKAIEAEANPGLAYDPIEDVFVAWSGGAAVYVLDPTTDTWTARPAPDTNAADPGAVTASGGVYGRFRYSRQHNVYVMVDRTRANVFLYRLADAR